MATEKKDEWFLSIKDVYRYDSTAVVYTVELGNCISANALSGT